MAFAQINLPWNQVTAVEIDTATRILEALGHERIDPPEVIYHCGFAIGQPGKQIPFLKRSAKRHFKECVTQYCALPEPNHPQAKTIYDIHC